MKKFITVVILIFVHSLSSSQNDNEIRQFDKLLNQFINVRDFCISKNGDEAFFTIQSPNQKISQIACIKKEGNEWSKPELLPFCDTYMYLEPFLSVDGEKLFFVSDRPLSKRKGVKKDFDVWYVTRHSRNDDWSMPINIGQSVNSKLNEFYPSLSENNNLYFTLESTNGFGKDDIYYSKWDEGKYSKPILLDSNINSIGYEFNAFISRKEDFIIFSKYNEPNAQGSGDLYISVKDNNGKWKKAINLGSPINTKYMEYCPFYDEKKHILYFTSKRNNMKSKKFKSISDFNNYIYESNNGLSKIYMTFLKIEKNFKK